MAKMRSGSTKFRDRLINYLALQASGRRIPESTIEFVAHQYFRALVETLPTTGEGIAEVAERAAKQVRSIYPPFKE